MIFILQRSGEVDMNQHVPIPSFNLELTVSDRGSGPCCLLLHGGAGPQSMDGLATALADKERSVLPTHPGFDGTRRPEGFNSVAQLARAYADLLDRLDLREVVAVGNSFGGWVGLELALLRPPRLKGVVALNAVGIDPGPDLPPIVDPARTPPAELPGLAFHDPSVFALRPSTPEAAQAQAENQRALRVYTGESFMSDPSLAPRLAEVTLPVLFGWGESDKIVGVDYGRRFARMVPGARFETIARAGHFPHIERRDAVLDLVSAFRRGLS